MAEPEKKEQQLPIKDFLIAAKDYELYQLGVRVLQEENVTTLSLFKASESLYSPEHAVTLGAVPLTNRRDTPLLHIRIIRDPTHLYSMVDTGREAIAGLAQDRLGIEMHTETAMRLAARTIQKT